MCISETEWNFLRNNYSYVVHMVTLPPLPVWTLCVHIVVSYVFFCVGMKYLNWTMLILENCRVITDKFSVS